MSIDDQGLVSFETLEKKDYSRLLLTRNPFPSTAVPSEVALTTADRQAVLGRFTDTLSALFTDSSSSVTVLLGDYGTGKSHLLKLFKVSVNSKLISSANPTLAIYIKSPGRSIRDLLLYMMDDLGRDYLTELASQQIFRFLSNHEPSKYLMKANTKLSLHASNVSLYLQNARIFDLIEEIEKVLDVKNSDLIRAFLVLPHPDLGSIGWRWFTGSSLSRDERQLLRITSTIDDSHIAEEALNAFLRLIHGLGFKGIVLLFDELEAITLIPGTGRGLYQDALRHLIDSNPKGMIAFFAITPTEWIKLTQDPSALERRLTGSVIDLQPFGEADVKELIKKYLAIARPKIDEGVWQSLKLSGPDRETFPFNGQAVDAIFPATKGIVYKVVMLCRLCIEYAATAQTDTIDSKTVELVIQKEGFR